MLIISYIWIICVTHYSLRVCDDVAENVVIRLLPVRFDVQLQLRRVNRLLVRLLVDERGGRRHHLLDPASNLWYLLHRLGGVLLLHRHCCLAGVTLDVLQAHLPAPGGRRRDVVVASDWRRIGKRGFVQVGQEFVEEAVALSLEGR